MGYRNRCYQTTHHSTCLIRADSVSKVRGRSNLLPKHGCVSTDLTKGDTRSAGSPKPRFKHYNGLLHMCLTGASLPGNVFEALLSSRNPQKAKTYPTSARTLCSEQALLTRRVSTRRKKGRHAYRSSFQLKPGRLTQKALHTSSSTCLMRLGFAQVSGIWNRISLSHTFLRRT